MRTGFKLYWTRKLHIKCLIFKCCVPTSVMIVNQMCISVSVAGNYLSVSVLLMSREYNHLQWPIKGILKIKLLNQIWDDNQTEPVEILLDEAEESMCYKRVCKSHCSNYCEKFTTKMTLCFSKCLSSLIYTSSDGDQVVV